MDLPPAFADRFWERSGMWANLGARLVSGEPGRVVVEAELVVERHGFPTTKGDIVHGGALAALADCALASAAASLANEGEIAATADLRVEYFRPGRLGLLRARAEVRHRTRRLAYCQVTIEQEDGTVVAEGRATLAYLTADGAP